MNKSVIIVAGGSGKRMDSALPKQFHLLNGLPVIIHTIKRFYDYDPSMLIILVVPESYTDYWKNICNEHNFRIPVKVVKGGKERFFSVRNGLSETGNCELIAIHDSVRPFVSREVIERCFNTALSKGNAIPCVPLTDSLRKLNENEACDRTLYRSIQTPQVFRSEILKKAYKQKYRKTFTDDATVIESIGENINLVDGNTENIKITTPMDMKFAEIILKY